MTMAIADGDVGFIAHLLWRLIDIYGADMGLEGDALCCVFVDFSRTRVTNSAEFCQALRGLAEAYLCEIEGGLVECELVVLCAKGCELVDLRLQGT